MKKLFIVTAIGVALCSGWFMAEHHAEAGGMHVAEKMVG
ncbi:MULTISPECIES: hypothetical protein [Bacillus]|nr:MULTISPECIES: hypothetical protein [Bacillus]QHZ46150.1 phosphatase [Bacillus sp. NSP9.1]WFA06376.1 phosphatase [Bacillus sp. HSf4]